MTQIPDFSQALLVDEQQVQRIRNLSIEERTQMFGELCRAAMQLQKSRADAGFPPSTPAPWPKSTWQYIRKWTSDARQSKSA